MPDPELPPLVVAFLTEHISTLEQFQVLLRLIQSPERWWDAAAAARELGMTERDAQDTLDQLAKHNLLDIRITGEVRYQFRPGTDALRKAAIASADTFRLRPVQVLQALTGDRRRNLRDFADAFRIRRDDDR
jgi:hypothetical protein